VDRHRPQRRVAGGQARLVGRPVAGRHQLPMVGFRSSCSTRCSPRASVSRRPSS
jgi:hypothetical protein